jgi:hypothetical protein
MKKESNSLLSLFLPPSDELTGIFGLLSGYSASEDFLETAIDNFTQSSSYERGSRGLLNLIVFLDKRQRPIQGIPGLYHALYSGTDRDFSLMHAKVGILAFAKDGYNPVKHIRVFVSTGNWTRAGMVKSMDLVWKLDMDILKECKKEDWVEVQRILDFFKMLIISYPIINSMHAELDKLLNIVPFKFSVEELESSRFISTFDEHQSKKNNMLELICHKFKRKDGVPRFNIMLCGSGFYEDKNDDKLLEVFKEVEEQLAPIAFTKQLNGYVAINGIDRWKFKELSEQEGRISWSIARIKDYKNKGNSERQHLHAKFIFGGNLRNGKYTQGKLYLGSGNLSKKGLLFSLNNSNGNVEAGVVLELYDISERDLFKELGFDSKCYSREELQAAQIEGDDFEISETIEYASPIRAIINFNIEKGQGTIEWNKEDNCFFHNKDGSLVQILKGQEKIELPLILFQQGKIVILDDKRKSYTVPIVTEDNEFCLTPPPKVDSDSALNILLGYPQIGDSVEFDEDGEPIERGSLSNKVSVAQDSVSNRYLSLSMEIVESIARMNHTTPHELLPGWIATIEFVLIKCLKDEDKKSFQSLGINFLAILKEKHFSPEFSSMQVELKTKYLQCLDKVAESWGMKDYPVMQGTA